MSSRLHRLTIFAGLAVVTALLLTGTAAHTAPIALAPYSLATFNGVPPKGATQPDDLGISLDGKNLWVGYGNGVDTSGKGGPSNVVEYEIATGKVLKNITIPGHVDGLKVDPSTGNIWATENEDGNPTLAVINQKSGTFKIYTFDPKLFDGGIDDLVFAGSGAQDVFIVTSSQTDPTKPVIVRVAGPLRKTDTVLAARLSGSPNPVLNVVTNVVEANDVIGDPDSMTLDPAGELVLDNRSDLSLYIVRSSASANPVLRIPLTLSGTPVEVNDTIFVTSTAGKIFATDTSTNQIYILSKPFFAPNEAYTAANKAGDIGLVDLNTGAVTPVVTGLVGPHGLTFLPVKVGLSPEDTD